MGVSENKGIGFGDPLKGILFYFWVWGSPFLGKTHIITSLQSLVLLFGVDGKPRYTLNPKTLKPKTLKP